MDVTMGALLLAAFFSINMLSLIYLGIIAVGMGAPARARRLFWRFCALPALALLLVVQYSVLIGPPPPFDDPAALAQKPLVLGRGKGDDDASESLKVGGSADGDLLLKQRCIAYHENKLS